MGKQMTLLRPGPKVVRDDDLGPEIRVRRATVRDVVALQAWAQMVQKEGEALAGEDVPPEVRDSVMGMFLAFGMCCAVSEVLEAGPAFTDLVQEGNPNSLLWQAEFMQRLPVEFMERWVEAVRELNPNLFPKPNGKTGTG